MSIQVIWTKKREEEFIRLADLDGMEAEIIRIRHKRYGRIKDIEKLRERGFYISVEEYDRAVKRLKVLYDLVQPESCILPPRQKTARDAYKVSMN